MIRSMTGYGRAEKSDGSGKITVEIKSVNNRYLDLNIRMPKKYASCDSKIRNTLKEYMQRGKTDVYISCQDEAEGQTCLHYNKELAKVCYTYMKEISRDLDLKDDVRLSDIARFPDVLTQDEISEDESELWNELEAPLREAAASYNDAREKEGERLKTDLLDKLEDMLKDTLSVEEHEPEIMDAYRKKITDKVTELLSDREIDESRIASEVVIFADKICTDEETVRLKSHIEAVKNALTTGGAIGRKLDFLAQEMNREANTILSKAGDLITSDIGISLKTSIEKVREQIQNIE